jgi:hypothetical protein
MTDANFCRQRYRYHSVVLAPKKVIVVYMLTPASSLMSRHFKPQHQNSAQICRKIQSAQCVWQSSKNSEDSICKVTCAIPKFD